MGWELGLEMIQAAAILIYLNCADPTLFDQIYSYDTHHSEWKKDPYSTMNRVPYKAGWVVHRKYNHVFNLPNNWWDITPIEAKLGPAAI